MKNHLLHTPDGVRDIYNGECKKKLLLQDKLHEVLLKYGCKGDDVIELKKLLIAHGYDQGITTDTKSSQYFRSSTRKMVLAYQKDNSLQVDGKAGPETIRSLGGKYE